MRNEKRIIEKTKQLIPLAEYALVFLTKLYSFDGGNPLYMNSHKALCHIQELKELLEENVPKSKWKQTKLEL
jgi:hypothetical protein